MPRPWIQVHWPPRPHQHQWLLRDDGRPVRRQLQFQHQHICNVRAAVHADGQCSALALYTCVSECEWRDEDRAGSKIKKQKAGYIVFQKKPQIRYAFLDDGLILHCIIGL